MNTGVILASGQGKRMRAGKNKIFLNIGGKPIIFYTLSVFEKSPYINKILIVARAEDKDVLQSLLKKYKFRKVKDIIPGGKERQYSAFNALRYLKNNGENKKSIVVFHNGVNPFVTEKELEEVVKAAKKYGAAVVGTKAKDTIREVDAESLSVKTPDRSRLWSMQTPQAIEFSLAFRAFFKAHRDNFLGTDDVSLVERLGKKVKIIEASENNFKITTPLDLELAKIILKNKR